LASIVKLAQ